MASQMKWYSSGTQPCLEVRAWRARTALITLNNTHTTQYNTIKHLTTPHHNTIPYNTIKHHTTPHHKTQYNTTQETCTIMIWAPCPMKERLQNTHFCFPFSLYYMRYWHGSRKDWPSLTWACSCARWNRTQGVCWVISLAPDAPRNLLENNNSPNAHCTLNPLTVG